VLSNISSNIYQAFEARPCTITGADFFAIRAARAEHLRKLRHLYPIPGPIPDEVTETMHDVPVRDGATIRVRVYQPVKGPPDEGSALVVMYHEGGWSMGDLTDEDMNCRLFVRELSVVAVNVEYRYVIIHFFTFPFQFIHEN
jgi:acetyl esterase/lipase